MLSTSLECVLHSWLARLVGLPPSYRADLPPLTVTGPTLQPALVTVSLALVSVLDISELQATNN